MKQLSQNKFESIRSFFQESFPNLTLIYMVIEKVIPGQIWVDNETKPQVCLIITGAPYCFISGCLDEDIFQQCFELMNEKKMLKLIIHPQPQFDLNKFGLDTVLRRHYRYADIQDNIPVYDNNSDYLIKKIDLETFHLCMWKTLITDIFGSAENYLENGLGYVLWDTRKQIIASESHGLPSKEFIEVGTVTHENYRGKNLSTILCNHLIRNAIVKRLKPIWTCDDSNIGSWKVAEKQDMYELNKYIFYTRLNSEK